jgi:hypothetical protein
MQRRVILRGAWFCATAATIINHVSPTAVDNNRILLPTGLANAARDTSNRLVSV